jgi:short-subunit dehydrogenase
MRQENKNRKIAVIGHTKGIGKAIADLYKRKKYEIVGLSRTTGYDLETDQEKIIEKLVDYELIVVNAYAKFGQYHLLKRIYSEFHHHYKKVVVITSTSGTPQGKDEDNYGADYNEYCWHKEHLIKYVSELQEELFNKPLSVYDVCPDVVDTDMIKGMWEGLPKLTAEEIADTVRYCFESTFNINKIVVQKNAG